MTVTLDPQLEQRIQREMERGHYREPSEVISHALNLLDAQEEWLLRNREAIDERLAESMAQAERGEVDTADEAARLLDQSIADGAARLAQLDARLKQLSAEWRRDVSFLSSDTDVVLHPAYQRIIGMGKAALPFILQDLLTNGGNWFWALAAITGANPVSPEDAGRTGKMKEAWQQWGRANHYL